MKPKYKSYVKGEGLSPEDFTRLYKDGFNRTCQIFFKLGYSPEDCQDLAQEVYLLVWRNRHALAGSPVSFWLLQVYKVLYNLKQGKYSDPLESLIVVRNKEIEVGEHPPPEREEDFVYDDALSQLPEVAQEYFRAAVAGYSSRDIAVFKVNTGIFYKVKRILQQPEVKAKLLEYLRG